MTSSLADIEAFARDAMDEHGLHGWAFGWIDSRATLGQTDTLRCRIELNRRAVGTLPDEDWIDTVLHEIAHALLHDDGNYPYASAHGPEWRRYARQVGAEPRATKSTGVEVPARWKGACGEGCKWTRDRLTRRMREAKCARHSRSITWLDNR